MANFVESPILSQRFSEAVTFALDKHSRQIRKDGSPYVAHLLSVSALVLENGGSEDDAIAALLHDVIEDVKIFPEEISSEFGQAVANVVVELSEPKEGEWRDRKLAYIDQIRNGSPSAVLVSLADKTHNALAYLKGARIGAKDGSQSKTEQTLWFLGELAQVYRDRLSGCYLVQFLELTLRELKILWGGETAHIVDGKFFSNACDWEREFGEPDYPDYPCPYPDDFSKAYWIAVRDKRFWFESPDLEKQPVELSQPVELLHDINIQYYESGEVFANVPVLLNGEELVIEVWGQSAEWLSSFAQKGTKTLIDVLNRDVVDGVRVVQAKISEVQLTQI